MLRINLWSQSVSRVELDQRSRDARLRFERTDEFFVVPRTVMHSRLRRLLYVFTVGRYGGLPHGTVRLKNRQAIGGFWRFSGSATVPVLSTSSDHQPSDTVRLTPSAGLVLRLTCPHE